MTVNIPMLKAMKKAGMKIECKRKKHFLLNGASTDLVYGAIWKA